LCINRVDVGLAAYSQRILAQTLPMTPRITGLGLSLGLTVALGFAFTPLGCGGSQEVASPPAKTTSGIPKRVAVGLADCARGGAARLQPASYTVRFNVHVSPGGEARWVELVGSTLGDRDVEDCMKGAFQSVVWPVPAAALRSSEAETGDSTAPHARGLIAQGFAPPVTPTMAGPFELFLRLKALAGGGVVVAEGAGASAAVAGETVAEGAATAAGGATIAGIGIFVAILFYSKPIAVGPGEWTGPPVASATSMPTTTAVPIATAVPTVAPVSRKDACTEMFDVCWGKAGRCIRVGTWGHTVCRQCQIECLAEMTYTTSECYRCGFE
jgi:hypothetical protein